MKKNQSYFVVGLLIGALLASSGFAMFLRLYIFRLGFLCGGAGFLYCLFVALEAFFRYAALHYDKDHLSNDVGRA